MPRLTTLWFAAILAALVVVGLPHSSIAQSPATEEQLGEQESYDPGERAGIRTGLLFNGLFAAENTSGVQYFDLGFQYKEGEYYVELHAPALTIIADGLLLLARMIVADHDPELFIEIMNRDLDPNHARLGHGRLGYRFLLVPPGDFQLWRHPLEAAVGIFGVTDMVAFADRRNIDHADAAEYGYAADPLVVGAGGFMALGRSYEDIAFDVALGVGRAVRGVENNPAREVTIVEANADVEFDPGFRRISFYIRPRITGYITRLSPATNVTGGLTGGIKFGY